MADGGSQHGDSNAPIGTAQRHYIPHGVGRLYQIDPENGRTMYPFTRLRTWTTAHTLSLSLYRATRDFPREERYGLVAQIRRATCSIEANIAEGAGRRTQADFRRFLDIASGSAAEVHCHLLIARDLEFLPAREADSLIEQVTIVKRMIAALARQVSSG